MPCFFDLRTPHFEGRLTSITVFSDEVKFHSPSKSHYLSFTSKDNSPQVEATKEQRHYFELKHDLFCDRLDVVVLVHLKIHEN